MTLAAAIPSSPLECTHSWTTSSVAFHHHRWKAYTIRWCQAWLVVISLRQHTRSDDVRRGFPAWSLGSIHGGRMTSDMACHHRLWAAHRVGRFRAWYAIVSLRQHIWWDDIGRDMLSLTFDNLNDWTTSGVACHHGPWSTHIVRRRRAWHAIITLVLHTRTDDVGYGMPTSPLCNTHSRTMSGDRSHHCAWVAHTD